MSQHGGAAEAEQPAGSWLDGAVQAVDRVSERVSYEMFRFGLYVTMPALVVLVTLDVMLRYVFNAPLQWARDVNGLLLLISIFCSLPHAWDRAYHIRMEVFYSRFTITRRRMADVLSSLSGVIVFGFMTVQAVRFVPFMIQTGETGEDLEFVLWPFMGVVAFCALVMVARVFANPAGVEDELRYRPSHGAAEGASGTASAPGEDTRCSP